MDDTQFEEVTISEVSEQADGWTIKREDGWCYSIPKPSPVAPQAGMTARFYGAGHGAPVRGLFLDGTEIFYRTAAEDEEHRQREMYGATVEDWLARWDEGRTVWTIEMGGLGPGYEQAIQITVAELVRHMIEAAYVADAWQDEKVWKQDRETIEKAAFANETISNLGLSGAQYGAALNVATNLYRRGPLAVFTDKRVKDRMIQASKNFPAV